MNQTKQKTKVLKKFDKNLILIVISLLLIITVIKVSFATSENIPIIKIDKYLYEPNEEININITNATNINYDLFLTSEKASGNKDTDLAVRLLAKVTTKELNTKHAVESTHIGILKSQAAYGPYKDDKFLSDVIYMLDYNYFMPNHTLFSTWEDAIWEGMQAAELGDRSPADSAAKAIKLLKAELGDALLIK